MPNKKLTMKKSRSAKREAKHEAKCETKHEAKREAARAFSFRFTFHVYICYFLFSFIFQIYVWSLYFSFAFQTFVSYLHVRFLFLVQIYDLNVWFLASAFCLLRRNDDENKKEIPCGAVFQSSRNSFRRVFGQSQFFSWELLCAICGGTLVRGFRLSRNSFRGNLG